MIQGQETHLYL